MVKVAANDTKVSVALQESLSAGRDDEPVDIVVEMTPPHLSEPGTQTERIEQAKRSFDDLAASVAATISAAGGVVLGTAWINSTVRGRVPASGIQLLLADDNVKRVDAPRKISRER